MAEYIDREAFIRALEEAEYDIHAAYEPDGFTFKCICEVIDSIPVVDVTPVVHGRWDNIPNTYMSLISKDGAYHGNATTCSVCHEVNPNAYKTNYCPNCGAKMDDDGNADH